MSAFNELEVFDERGDELLIQFKFGSRDQRKYRLGDEVNLGKESPSALGRFEISGLAMDTKTQVWRFFAIALNGRKLVSYREINESEYEQLYKEEG